MAQCSRDLCYQAKTLTVFFAYRPKYSYDGRGIDAAIGRSVSVASLLLVVDLTEHLSATPRSNESSGFASTAASPLD
jgi:hypothetical protein